MDLSALDALDARLTLDANHAYRLDGKRVPGVTTIIKAMDAPALDRWHVKQERAACIAAAEALFYSGEQIPRHYFAEAFEAQIGKEYEGQRLGREAADAGKEVHALIEQWCRARLGVVIPEPPASDESHARFSAWLQWAQAGDFEPLAVERRVYSQAHGYAGTVDLFAIHEGAKKVVDWKSSAHYLEQELQSVAYRKAAEEMGLGEWGGLLVVVPRDGSAVRPEPVRLSPAAAFEAFLACRTLYDAQRGFRK